MKTLLRAIPLFLLLLIVSATSNIFAQEADTLDVAPLPPGNINNVINGDTLAGGVRAHPNRVYRLERTKVYQVTQSLRINGDLKVIATEGDGRPPVLAPAILPDLSSVDHFFNLVGKGSRVEIKDLYLLSCRADQAFLGWSDGIRINADSINLILDGVVFDAFSNRGISLSAAWNKMNVQNCIFRNHMHASGAYYGGGPYQSDLPYAQDTIIFKNNTFFSNNSCNFSVRAFDTYALFEHNTLAYGIVYTFLLRNATNLHLKNNLFYSMQSFGGTQSEVYGGSYTHWPDTVSTGIIAIRTQDTTSSWYDRILEARVELGDPTLNEDGIWGTEAYLDSSRGVTIDLVRVEDREYEITNNGFFWPQELKDFYATYNDTSTTMDTVQTYFGTTLVEKRRLILPSIITEYTQMSFDSLLAPFGAEVLVANNNEVSDPGFPTDVNNHIQKVNEFIAKIVRGAIDTAWWFNPSGENYYPPKWPVPENLRYTNSALMSAGSDGKPLGDLRWFPEFVDVQEDNELVPFEYSLSEAYPNPFNPSTNFKFSIAKTGNVRLAVYNILGQKVKTLLNNDLTAGNYTAKWDGRDENGMNVSSGVYFFQLESGSFNMTKKMVLMK